MFDVSGRNSFERHTHLETSNCVFERLRHVLENRRMDTVHHGAAHMLALFGRDHRTSRRTYWPLALAISERITLARESRQWRTENPPDSICRGGLGPLGRSGFRLRRSLRPTYLAERSIKRRRRLVTFEGARCLLEFVHLAFRLRSRCSWRHWASPYRWS